MKEYCLIDGDIVAYRCAATCEGLPAEIAEVRTGDLIRRILHETNAQQYKVFLTGSNNFRYDIYPDYKAHRKDKPRPEHWNTCKEYLVKEWQAQITDGYEADDALGIEQVASGTDSVIASIDKDLLQIPGYHYNFVTGVERFVSPFDATRFFYKQIISGDGADNVPSYDGKVRNGVPKFIQRLLDPIDSMMEEEEMYNYVYEIYQNHYGVHFDDPAGFAMKRNAQVLYIWKKENDKYVPVGERESTNQD